MKKPDQVAKTWMRGFKSLGEKCCRLLNRHVEWDSGVHLIRVRGLSVLCANAAYELQKCKGSRPRAKISVGFDLWQKEMRDILEAYKSVGF